MFAQIVQKMHLVLHMIQQISIYAGSNKKLVSNCICSNCHQERTEEKSTSTGNSWTILSIIIIIIIIYIFCYCYCYFYYKCKNNNNNSEGVIRRNNNQFNREYKKK